MNLTTTPLLLNLAVALGIGLLIGVERERRKGQGQTRAPAGIRTFTIASLAGAVSLAFGGEIIFALVVAGVIALTAAAYWRARDGDPGLTTEIALILATLLGGVAMQQPTLAAGLGVTVTILLAARTRLHQFVRKVLTEDELEDALIFLGATLVILPILPDQPMGPYGALNPHKIWILVILILAIGGAGYLTVRLLGSHAGLPIAGLASGFISSTATIGAMGARAAANPSILSAAVAAAVLSTVATMVQMALVLGATSVATLKVLTVPLIFAGVTALFYAAISTFRAMHQPSASEAPKGRAFSFKTAIVFALSVSAILVVSAALQEWYGGRGVIVAAALAGLVDTHSAAISVAALVSTGKLSASDALLPILMGLTTNTVSKMVMAAVAGGRAFALRVIPGLLLVIVAAWAGMMMA